MTCSLISLFNNISVILSHWQGDKQKAVCNGMCGVLTSKVNFACKILNTKVNFKFV